MKFTTRLALYTVAPAVVFVAALGASLWGLLRTQAEFDRYLNTEQAIATGLTEMYGHGLQMGQALRNIVLDPGNRKAYDNFAAAEQAYARTHRDTLAAAGTSAAAAALRDMAALRDEHARQQARVVALVRSDLAAATKALTADETPAWRNLRARLLEQIEASRQVAAAQNQATQARARQATLASVALATVAIVVATVLCLVLMRTLARELGGDPAQAREALRHIADGDLTMPLAQDRSPQGLLGELERTQARLRTLVDDIRNCSDSIHTASAEIATGNQDLSHRTEQTAANLQQTASSMEQLTGTVAQSAGSAAQADRLATTAAEVAARGGAVVDQVVVTMDEIHAGSKKIADITGVIDGIAFQTNILALNAAVEAARAGEQGRGFAVVAGEVRTLAQRSAEAAREIKALIGRSVDRVEAGSRLVNEAGATMQEIVDSVRRVTDTMGQISTAAAEQSGGIGLVNAAVAQLDQMTQQNAALVEQSAAAAASLREQAHRLTEVVGIFKVDCPGARTPA